MPEGRKLTLLLEGLVAVTVASRDAFLVPSCAHAVGAVVSGPGRLTVYVPEATGEDVLWDLAASGAVAVVLDRPTTHRSVQVKGRCVEIRPASESERGAVERCVEAFRQQVEGAGVAPAAARRLHGWPCRAVTLEVLDVFEQTPGPRAGLPVAAEGPA